MPFTLEQVQDCVRRMRLRGFDIQRVKDGMCQEYQNMVSPTPIEDMTIGDKLELCKLVLKNLIEDCLYYGSSGRPIDT